jgi:GntR family transcriptional regulator
MTIKKNSPIPIYYQLAETIREQIDSGELQPGEQLPSERELSEQHAISRMTARQALSYLVRQGRLVAKPGIGTFVAEPKLTHDTLHLLGFTEEMLRQGQAAVSQVLEQGVVSPPAAVAARLEMRSGEAAVKIVRLRFSQDVPLLLETVFIPLALAPGLEVADLAQTSLYTLLEQRYGLHLDHARQTLEAVTATDEEVALFEIPPGTSMLLLEGVTYTFEEQPVEFFKAVYRGDKFKYALESHRYQWTAEEPVLPRLSMVLNESL